MRKTMSIVLVALLASGLCQGLQAVHAKWPTKSFSIGTPGFTIDLPFVPVRKDNPAKREFSGSYRELRWRGRSWRQRKSTKSAQVFMHHLRDLLSRTGTLLDKKQFFNGNSRQFEVVIAQLALSNKKRDLAGVIAIIRRQDAIWTMEFISPPSAQLLGTVFEILESSNAVKEFRSEAKRRQARD